jgi:hypothetical protein
MIILLSTASANIINKRYLAASKLSLLQVTGCSYLVALIGSIVTFLIENKARGGKACYYCLFSYTGLSNAEEVINVIMLN